VDIGEAVVAALETVRELGVVQTEEVHGGGVEVVDVNGVTNDVVTEIIGFSVNVTAANSGAGHEDAEAARVVIASVVVTGERALGVDGATELAAPDDECVLEKAAFFEF